MRLRTILMTNSGGGRRKIDENMILKTHKRAKTLIQGTTGGSAWVRDSRRKRLIFFSPSFFYFFSISIVFSMRVSKVHPNGNQNGRTGIITRDFFFFLYTCCLNVFYVFLFLSKRQSTRRCVDGFIPEILPCLSSIMSSPVGFQEIPCHCLASRSAPICSVCPSWPHRCEYGGVQGQQQQSPLPRRTGLGF
jgi:hypothetical protein